MKSLLGQVLNARDQTSTTITASLESHHSTAMRWKQIQVSNIMGNGSGNAGGTVSDLLSATCENGNPLPDQLVVVAQSGGFQAGNFARIEMNRDGKGQRVPGAFSRGLNVVVMDPLDGGIIESAGFDTHMHPEDSDEFAKLIEWLEPGMLVVLVSKDDCSENLTEAAKVACESLGSTMIRRVEYRDSWCLVGEKGATSASEAHKSASLGPTESITKTFDLAARRKKVLSTLPTGGTAGTANKYNSVDLLLSTSSGAATNVFLPSNGRVS